MSEYRRNGYKMLYMPDHHRACKSDGMVYEHIVLAEQYIGREISSEEEVHHDNEIKDDNSENNLIVFKSAGDHARYHKTGIRSVTEDGSYIAPKITKPCEFCGDSFETTEGRVVFCSHSCAGKSRRKSERPNAEELKWLIDTNGFCATGRKFGVSDNAIRKWAKQYGIL